MAVKKLSTSTSLQIEVQNGTDSNGKAKYSTKSFSGLKNTAADADVLVVGKAICEVLKNDTNGIYVNNKSLLADDGE